MSFLTDEDRRAKMYEKADVVMLWLAWIEEQYADLISRLAETDSMTGFNDLPTTRPCEHRAAWRRGKLCLACDNTGWRKATKKEREEGIARDPYSFELPKSTVNIVQSESARRAQEAARIDSIISTIDRHARVREGRDSLEDKNVRQFRLIASRPRQARQVLAALRRIQDHGFDMFIDRYELALLIGSLIGRKLEPPRTVGSSARI